MKRLLLSILLVSVIILFWYPSIANYFNNSIHDVTISEYEDKIKSPKKENQYLQAVKWNEDHSIDKYDNVLNIKNGMMGYLEINGYGIRLPIYHYDSYSSLEKGVGHNKDSSLPIGGKDTHCILSGHSGMTNEKMFDDLIKIKIGDIFKIDILDHICAYKVYDIKKVLPNEVDKYIKLQKNKDLCTLITCTPYGVNTHRLLVRGIRTDYNNKVSKNAFSRDDYTPFYVILSIISVLILFNLLWNKLFNKGMENKNEKDS